MPALRSSSASCQRLLLRASPKLSCASSSRMMTSGCAASAASRSNSSKRFVPIVTSRGGIRGSPSARRSRSGRPFVSIQPIATRRPAACSRRASVSSRRVLPAPGAAAIYTTSRARSPNSRRSASAERRRAASRSSADCSMTPGPFFKMNGVPAARSARVMAALCYALLAIAWVIDLVTPQLFIAAILFNGPIALSSIALRPSLTIRLVDSRRNRESRLPATSTACRQGIIGMQLRSAIGCS